MHLIYELATGIGIGIIMALPTGPIGFLVVRRMILYGWRAGMWSALGSITGDIFYATIALLGLVHIQKFITSIQDPVRLAAGFYLLYLGVQALRKAKHNIVSQDKEFSPTNDFLSTFILSISSPHNLAPFLIAFSIVGFGSKITGGGGWIFAGALLAGSLLWWISCGLGIERAREQKRDLNGRTMRLVTSWILIGSGIFFIITAILQFIF